MSDRATSEEPRRAHSANSGSYPHPCDETFEVGPFLFECAGHMYCLADLCRFARNGAWGGLISHQSASPGMVGDVELRWWTEP